MRASIGGRACSAEVASSGVLSSRTLTRRGKRIEIPLSGSANPSAALCRGEMLKSAHLTSHTVFASNQMSGSSVSEYLRRNKYSLCHPPAAKAQHEGVVRSK